MESCTQIKSVPPGGAHNLGYGLLVPPNTFSLNVEEEKCMKFIIV